MSESVRFKRGYYDAVKGLFFYRYNYGKEIWVTPDDFEKKKEQDKLRNKKHAAKKDNEAEKKRLRNFRANNPEKCRDYARNWRKKNRNLCIKRSLASRAKKIEEYREKEKKKMREYRMNNPIKSRAIANLSASKRRAAMRAVKSSAHDKYIEFQLRLIASRLSACLDLSFHIDHIVPISKGGIHHHSNLRILPARLNQIKYNRADKECSSDIEKAIKNWTPCIRVRGLKL